jgi:hypothetical protein
VGVGSGEGVMSSTTAGSFGGAGGVVDALAIGSADEATGGGVGVGSAETDGCGGDFTSGSLGPHDTTKRGPAAIASVTQSRWRFMRALSPRAGR